MNSSSLDLQSQLYLRLFSRHLGYFPDITANRGRVNKYFRYILPFNTETHTLVRTIPYSQTGRWSGSQGTGWDSAFV